ncbi:MAG: hypothetical protein VB093_20580 [Propionicimonas sp.]|nr:hypothetical protein [Propionicimonas sp.]MEA5118401.1 hypothetical protein [Propionicimonas sp.]
MISDTVKIIAGRVVQARKRRRISERALAKAADISRSTRRRSR